MNVLVYSGPEVLQSSVNRSISLLKSLLQPNYTVQAITPQSLSSQPWSIACALLVIPACRENLCFIQTLSTKIRSYVEDGGRFLGIRAGIRTSGGSILSPSEYTTRFSDKISGFTIYYKTIPGGDEDLQQTSLRSPSLGILEQLQFTETPESIGIDKLSNVQVLARYTKDDTIAGSLVRLGEGKAVFWGVHLENPVPTEEQSDEAIRAAARLRLDLVRETLRLLGLKLPVDAPDLPSCPLPQILTSTPSKTDVVKQILESLEIVLPGKLEDANDTFYFYDHTEGQEILLGLRSETASQEDDRTKRVVVYTSGELPPASTTPLFDISRYYTYLDEARKKTQSPSVNSSWAIGEALIYGEVVTSTQTLLDR